MSKLSDEISNDPLGVGYSAMISAPGKICELLNQPSRPAAGAISHQSFAVWCAASGFREVLEDATQKGAPLRSAALTLVDFLRGGLSLDLSSKPVQTMLQGCVPSLLSQSALDTLMSAAQTKISRAQELGIPPVTEDDLRAI